MGGEGKREQNLVKAIVLQHLSHFGPTLCSLSLREVGEENLKNVNDILLISTARRSNETHPL